MLQELQFFKKSLFLIVLYVSNFQVLTFIDRDFYRDTWDISMFETHILEIVGRHRQFYGRRGGTKVNTYRDQEEIKLHNNSANATKEIK